MQRIFPNQFRKSYFSMNLAELQQLQTDIKAITDDSLNSRILLTSVNSLRFKVNSDPDIHPLINEALKEVTARIATAYPKAQPTTGTVPKVAPSHTVHKAQIESVQPKDKQPKAEKPKSDTTPLKDTSTPSLNGRAGEGPFPHPLVVGPLRHEATHVQELYYLPLAQLHNQLFLLVQKSLKDAISKGWQGEDTHTKDRPWSLCFSPNTERASLQQRILKLDNQLQNFWNRYHLAIDEINGTDISPETRDEIAKETRACNSPSLSTTDDSRVSKSLGSYTKKEIEAGLIPEGTSIEELITARQLRNKKLLNRHDRQKTEAHKQTIIEAVTELHDWQIPIEQGQVKTALYYGYEVPLDWQRHKRTPEEKRLIHNADQKKSNDKKQALKREMKAAFEAEAKAQFQDLINQN